MRNRIDLFIASVLVLFLELACIRWFPAHVLFLTFFTNVMLLASFLGISVGCLAAGRRQNYLRMDARTAAPGAWRCVSDRVGTAENRQRRAGRQLPSRRSWCSSASNRNRGTRRSSSFRSRRSLACSSSSSRWRWSGPASNLGGRSHGCPNRIEGYTVNIAGASPAFCCSRHVHGGSWDQSGGSAACWSRSRISRSSQSVLSTAVARADVSRHPAARVLRRGAGHRTLGHHPGVLVSVLPHSLRAKSRASSP